MTYKSSVPMFWRLQGPKYRLVGSRCRDCMGVFFPPRDVCPNCRKRSTEEHELKGTGEIVSYTIIRSAPEGFDKYVPYVVAIIKLDEGTNISGQIVGNDTEKIKTGARVRPVFRRMFEDGSAGLIQYGVKWVLD